MHYFNVTNWTELFRYKAVLLSCENYVRVQNHSLLSSTLSPCFISPTFCPKHLLWLLQRADSTPSGLSLSLSLFYHHDNGKNTIYMEIA